jgi:hypothetical protein
MSIKRATKVVSLKYAADPTPRGFYRATYGGAELAVRIGYHLVPCDGEAHRNAFIDNCGQCLGHVWGWVAIPLACGTMKDARDAADRETEARL